MRADSFPSARVVCLSASLNRSLSANEVRDDSRHAGVEAHHVQRFGPSNGLRPAPLRPRASGNCVRMGRVFSPEGPLTQRHSRVRSEQRGSGRSLPRAESSVSLKPSLPVCWASVSAHCTIGNRAPAGPPAPRVCCCGWRHTIRKQSLRRRLDEFGPTGELWIRRSVNWASQPYAAFSSKLG
jgi:hypothetical protein